MKEQMIYRFMRIMLVYISSEVIEGGMFKQSIDELRRDISKEINNA